ncbi:unnamed protein product [Paramecium octaurelia]|uniref:Uncharacterized protein n=1 Tax=Paramecium octaurelia TaxID=43137 RepID=A0A8S1V4M5_PAROT|nr:unnamed protein product [Paramecium octaurelia]
MKKIGRWMLQCGYNTDITYGGYFSDGLRVGPWKLPIYNYWKRSQPIVYEVGEYCDDQKQGRWNYIMNNQIIGGGYYEEECTGLKTGNWIELDDDINNLGQVIQEGQYMKGNKVGVWRKLKKVYQQNYIH